MLSCHVPPLVSLRNLPLRDMEREPHVIARSVLRLNNFIGVKLFSFIFARYKMNVLRFLRSNVRRKKSKLKITKTAAMETHSLTKNASKIAQLNYKPLIMCYGVLVDR